MGSGSYVLRRRGAVVWQGERPFFLRMGVVGDDGSIIGCSMTGGPQGFGKEPSEAIVWRLSPNGVARALRRYPQTRRLDRPASPLPVSVGLLERSQRALVAVGSDYLLYDLRTGKAEGELDVDRLEPAGDLYLRDLEPVPGTELVVACYFDRQQNLIAVLGSLQGKRLWTTSFSNVGQWFEANRLSHAADRTVILPTRSKGHFALRLGNERIEYKLDASGAPVELGRTPYKPFEIRTAFLDAVPLSPLPLAKTVRLQTQTAEPSAIHNVSELTLVGPNRFAFLEADREGPVKVVVSDTTGAVLKRMDVDPPMKDTPMSTIHSLGSGKLLVSGMTNELWIADYATGLSRPIKLDGLDRFSGGLKAAVAEDGTIAVSGDTELPDGGFTSYLAAYTASGKRLWSKANLEVPDMFPEAMGFDSSGRLLVLDSVGKEIVVLSVEGEPLDRLALLDAQGNRLKYPVDLSIDPQGGFLVQDFRSEDKRSPTMYRYDADGKLRSAFTPHYPDGTTFYCRNAVRIDGKGRLWASDRYAILELDPKGAVIRTLGEPLDVNRISELGHFGVTPSGEAFLLDTRTATLHAFNPDGSLKYRFHPAGVEASSDLNVTVDSQGIAFLSGTPQGEIVIDSRGLAVNRWGEAPTLHQGSRPSLPASRGKRWDTRKRGAPLSLRDSGGRTVRKIFLKPDGSYLGDVNGAAVSADGALCVWSAPAPESLMMALLPAGESSVSIYGPDGTPRTTFRLPISPWFSSTLGFNGRTVVMPFKEFLYGFDVSGKPLWRVSLASIPERRLRAVTTDGKYLVTATARELEFYALPQP